MLPILPLMGTSSLQARRLALQRLIRELRTEKGVRQVELAELLGLPQSYVSKFESGERRLEFVMVEAICGALGVPFSDFLRRWGREDV